MVSLDPLHVTGALQVKQATCFLPRGSIGQGKMKPRARDGDLSRMSLTTEVHTQGWGVTSASIFIAFRLRFLSFHSGHSQAGLLVFISL